MAIWKNRILILGGHSAVVVVVSIVLAWGMVRTEMVECPEPTFNPYQTFNATETTPLGTWLAEGGDPNLRLSDGSNILSRAQWIKGSKTATYRLLAAGADPNSPTFHGKYSQLMFAAKDLDYFRVFLLVEYGADLHYTSPDGKTALDLAKERLVDDIDWL